MLSHARRDRALAGDQHDCPPVQHVLQLVWKGQSKVITLSQQMDTVPRPRQWAQPRVLPEGTALSPRQWAQPGQHSAPGCCCPSCLKPACT